jgi:hypothetical protein
MGHAGEDTSDLYDMIRRDVKFRREQAEKAGIGFTLPSKVAVMGRNGRKHQSFACKCMIQERKLVGTWQTIFELFRRTLPWAVSPNVAERPKEGETGQSSKCSLARLMGRTHCRRQCRGHY